MKNRINCSLLGLADHEGIANVGGRLGALSGPEFFRKYFFRFKGTHEVRDFVKDLGDVSFDGKSQVQKHESAALQIERVHRVSKSVSIVVGGGHDFAFAQLNGLSRALLKQNPKGRLGCLNIDAHLDVRPVTDKITSGSPFYLALESKTLSPQRLIEFGIQTHANQPVFWEYVKSKRIPVVSFSELRGGRAIKEFKAQLSALSKRSDWICLSLDLDAVAEAYAPGVSAPQSEGFTASEAIEFCEIAGENPKVVSLGIYELSPPHDVGDQTSRLAATCGYHFVEAVLGRKS